MSVVVANQLALRQPPLGFDLAAVRTGRCKEVTTVAFDGWLAIDGKDRTSRLVRVFPQLLRHKSSSRVFINSDVLVFLILRSQHSL